ncbi:MAG TPA: hypothetical protein VG937_16770 [Polyangiaceae bacterium]|nr:hypothetical protein [Polyangiaceae bacterium]
MAGPVLIVELPIADTTRAETAVLVQACSDGLGAGRCQLSASSEPADGVAIVSLRGSDGLGVLIEVGNRRSESRSWRSQEITFQPQDARVERFRTIGLAIATLYKEARLEAPDTASRGKSEPAAARATPGEKPATSKAASADSAATRSSDEATLAAIGSSRQGRTVHPRGWLSAGAITAYDHQLSSPFRFGGQLALGVAPIELPLFATLSGSYAVGRISGGELSSPIALSWATIALGTGGYWSLIENLQLRISVQGVLVKLEAHGSDPERGQQESQRWLMGGQAGVELVGWASRRWGLSFGPQVQQLTGGTAIAVHGRPVAEVAALSFLLGASVELRPFQR